MSDEVSSPLRVLVSGSRRIFSDERVFRRLADLPVDTVIIQGAGDGVDGIARAVAWERGWVLESYSPRWAEYGKAAGPRRNQQMIDEGKPNLVLAFPDAKSVGTRDLIARARRANIEIEVIELD